MFHTFLIIILILVKNLLSLQNFTWDLSMLISTRAASSSLDDVLKVIIISPDNFILKIFILLIDFFVTTRTWYAFLGSLVDEN